MEIHHFQTHLSCGSLGCMKNSSRKKKHCLYLYEIQIIIYKKYNTIEHRRTRYTTTENCYEILFFFFFNRISYGVFFVFYFIFILTEKYIIFILDIYDMYKIYIQCFYYYTIYIYCTRVYIYDYIYL